MTCKHATQQECYANERAFYPEDVLHCNDCDHRVRFPKNSHPHTNDPQFSEPCTTDDCKGTLHWLWACNAEIVHDDWNMNAPYTAATERHTHPIALF